MKWAAVMALTALACVGCSGDDGSASGDQGATSVVKHLEAKVSAITKTVKITEDNDPNGDIGRPGSYVEAVSIYDSRATCDSDLDITCGAKLEVFDTEKAATVRRDYIQSIAEGSGGLVSEYDYLDGKLLLRVTDQLKPTEAKEYEAAFSG